LKSVRQEECNRLGLEKGAYGDGSNQGGFASEEVKLKFLKTFSSKKITKGIQERGFQCGSNFFI